jgi:hypothetical protein
MKKTIGLFVAAAMAAGLAAADRVQLSLAANILVPADSAYRDVYGGGPFMPELKAACFLAGGFYAWAGYGWISADGLTPVLKEPAESRQGFLAAGAGYSRPLAGGWGLGGELGLARVAYREETLGKDVSGSALGLAVNGVLRRDLGARFFILLQAGYLYGKKTIEDAAVRFGGVKVGLGAGVRF